MTDERELLENYTIPLEELIDDDQVFQCVMNSIQLYLQDIAKSFIRNETKTKLVVNAYKKDIIKYRSTTRGLNSAPATELVSFWNTILPKSPFNPLEEYLVQREPGFATRLLEEMMKASRQPARHDTADLVGKYVWPLMRNRT